MKLPPRPRKGTKCRSHKCRRPATEFDYLGHLVRGYKKLPKRRMMAWERLPYCTVHGLANRFGLDAYKCPSRECLRNRLVAAGGWLNSRTHPEDLYVYIPAEATLVEPPTVEEGPKPIPPAKVHCPWCGTLMREVR
jgi:hypothetical protein